MQPDSLGKRVVSLAQVRHKSRRIAGLDSDEGGLSISRLHIPDS
jgi:hypothetical protein